MNPSSPSDQRNRSKREERSRSRERAPPHSSSQASQQPQPVVPPSGIPQTQTLATQGANEDSATVDPQNRVNNRSRPPQKTEGQEKLLQKIIRVNYQKPESTSQWIQMRKTKNLKMSLEPLQPLNLLYQYFLIINDKQKNIKDQLSLTILRMMTVNIAMNKVHKIGNRRDSALPRSQRTY